eukprot:TRINITY_DN11828_c0_g1_i1.p1 TRINITY_DN11828_c0_g1~~TRINITY_DN11828_c0_g1_i1.p1  ORF type:complete len:169 (+),score=37.99 TRINITY_DN11828_c0_g1_i1:79-585(+)
MEVGGKKRLRERKDKSRSLDETTRARILAKRLDHLEDDTLSDGDWNTGKEEDAFLDEARGLKRTKPKKKKKRKTSSKAQQVEKSHLFRYRTKAKSINQIIAEERVNKGLTTPPPILTCLSAPCSYPATKYCSVCSRPAKYQCVQCGMRTCSAACKDIHDDTRCMKHVV